MAGVPSERQPEDKPEISLIIQSLSAHQISDNQQLKERIIEKPRTDLEGGEREQNFFARTWTRKERILLSALGILAAVLITLIIALPVVFMTDRSDHDGDDWRPFRPKHDDPSYQVARNRPILALWDFPDPGLIQHNGTWYAFGTNPRRNDPNSIHVPTATSTNFVNWTLHENYDAMPTIGGWEREVNHWAPDAIQRDDGKFVLYYSGQTKDFGRHHCVGAAVSKGDDPLGPYVPLTEPLACPHQYGGAIDPSPIRDVDGKMYIVYKGDGNSAGSGGYCGNTKMPRKPVPILLHELESDGVTPIGEPTTILNIIKSDGPLIEAPNIIRTNDGTYYLFFSSHCFTSLGYNVKYAHATSIKGPYTRVPRPLLQTGDFGLEAPGGATVSPDGTKMVFHANCGGWRCMYASAIDIRPNNHTVDPSSLQHEIPGNFSTATTTSSLS